MGYYKDKGTVQIGHIRRIDPDIKTIKDVLDSIILHKGKLSDEEWEELEMHSKTYYNVEFCFVCDLKRLGKTYYDGLGAISLYSVTVDKLDLETIKASIKEDLQKHDNEHEEKHPLKDVKIDLWE